MAFGVPAGGLRGQSGVGLSFGLRAAAAGLIGGLAAFVVPSVLELAAEQPDAGVEQQVDAGKYWYAEGQNDCGDAEGHFRDA